MAIVKPGRGNDVVFVGEGLHHSLERPSHEARNGQEDGGEDQHKPQGLGLDVQGRASDEVILLDHGA
jgi:hypothetical protein